MMNLSTCVMGGCVSTNGFSIFVPALRRRAEWVSPTDCTIRVVSTRLVSLTQRSVAAIEYEVEAVDVPGRLVIQSELVAN